MWPINNSRIMIGAIILHKVFYEKMVNRLRYSCIRESSMHNNNDLLEVLPQEWLK